MSDSSTATPTVHFKDTLNLPRTNFPIRAQSQENDPKIIQRWKSDGTAQKAMEINKDQSAFILHDGPPYANGNIHIGHAYNKILKDIVTKSQRMMGKYVPVIPGWDCHGLPIEIKVSQDNPGVTGAELKKLCRTYAEQWITQQKEQFKQLGVFMDWDHSYATMDHGYEAETVRAFAKFVEGGYIEHKNKTVPWCASCQTVLASAEIEYQERKDPSLFVRFPLAQETINTLIPACKDKEVSILVWTTTPWTLPLNRSVLLKPHTQYVVIDCNGTLVIVGATRAQAIANMLSIPLVIVAELNADQLAGYNVFHPFIQNFMVPLIADQSVLTDDGTAVVHCAPGAGPEDYEVGVKNSLEIYSPVGPDGRYDATVIPQELVGMTIADGQIWVLKTLAVNGRILHKASLRHSYPHCWRCHNGLIFRATKQWFCDLSKNNLKESTLKAIDGLQTVPENSKNRLLATVDGRLEWCLSRQRVWGTPITALLCNDCQKPTINQALMTYAADQIEKQGIEWWDSVSLEELKKIVPACGCGSTNFSKETNILDVWFDSGISHQAVLARHNQFSADMYLEGKDQHRGWFQSSLLTSMVIEHKPPMKIIMTHGFTVDGQGKKMSKSLGNTISPQEMIARLGTDGLRLWAAMIDCSGEAVVSDVLLNNVQQVFKKIRNTARFLLSVLYDYNHMTDAISTTQLSLIDRYALEELAKINAQVIQEYSKYNFTGVAHILADYCAVQLSALYLDIIKDRLYCDKVDGRDRRSAQTVCYNILDALTKLCAPILSITAEQIFDEYKQDGQESIHLQTFVHNLHAPLAMMDAATKSDPLLHKKGVIIDSPLKAMVTDTKIDVLLQLRSALLKAVELVREQGIVKHSLEAHITCFVEPGSAIANLWDHMQNEMLQEQTLEQFLKEFLIVSKVTVLDAKGECAPSTIAGLWIAVEHVQGVKCPRCWHWTIDGNAHDLCNRCVKLV